MKIADFLQQAKEKGLDIVQVTEEACVSNHAYITNFNLDYLHTTKDTSYRIVAEKDKKVVSLTSNYLAEELIDLLFQKLLYTETSYENFFVTTEYVDPDLTPQLDCHQDLKLLTSLKAKLGPLEQVSVLEQEYTYQYLKTRIVNTLGAYLKMEKEVFHYYTEVTMKEGEKISNHNHDALVSQKEELNFFDITMQVLKLAELGLRKKVLPSGNYNILFSSSAMGSLLEKFIPLFSQELIRKKQSCLEGKLGKKIFPSTITIIENPTNQAYPGYSLFDEEGSKTNPKKLISNGVLKTYLYDNKEALLSKIESTANGYEKITTRNAYLACGTLSEKDLLKEMEEGIYVCDFGVAMDGIQYTTASLSIQLLGYYVKKGKIEAAIEPCILTTDLFHLLEKAKAIGSDLSFHSLSMGAPSVLFHDMFVAAPEANL